MTLSALSEDRLVTREETASWSAGSGLGSASRHLPVSRERVSDSPVTFLIRISWNWSSGMVRIFVVAVSVPLEALAASLRFDHQTSPPRTAKRTTAMRSPFGFIALSPLPPGGHAEADHPQREDHDAQPEDGIQLVGGERERPVLGGSRTDGDQVLVRRQPVDHVAEEVA